MRRTFALGALVALVTLTGCKSWPGPEIAAEGPYGQVLKRLTRRGTLYSGLEARAFVQATLLTPELVTAQAAEISRMRSEPPDVAARTAERLRAQYARPTFFAAVHTPDPSWNDWDETPSVWRVALDWGEGQREPARIERYDRPNADLHTLYPFLDNYSIAYFVQYPDGVPIPKTGSLLPVATASWNADGGVASPPPPTKVWSPARATLTVAGSLGQLELSWDLTQQQ